MVFPSYTALLLHVVRTASFKRQVVNQEYQFAHCCTSMTGEPIEVQSMPRAFPKRHPVYYFDDGSLVVLVESTLFNVHRSTFTRHSRVFSDVFSLPKPVQGQCVEGSSDECPLQFPGISSTDFERLMSIIYPADFGEHKPRTVEEWTSILHLATRWEFDSIRHLAIHKLEGLTISPVDKIVLSRQFNINTPWTLTAYTDICQRPDTLTVFEARALGLETAMRIYQLREKLRGGNSRLPSRNGSSSPPRATSGPHSAPEIRRTMTRRETLSHPPRSGTGVVRATPTLAKTQSVKVPARRPLDASRLVAEAFDLEG